MRRRRWPNGYGVTVRAGRFDVEFYAPAARDAAFTLPAGISGASFTHDARFSGWPILVTYTVRT